LLKAGSATITAQVAADNNYAAAAAIQTITIARGASTVTLTAANTLAVGTYIPVTVATTGSTAGYSLSSSDIAKLGIAGSAVYAYQVPTTGTVTLTAAVAADSNYAAATTSKSLTITKGTSTITMTSTTSGVVGNTIILTYSKTGSTGNVTYTSSNTQVVSISGSVATLVSVGTATITATLVTDNDWNAVSTTQVITVQTKGVSTITYTGATSGYIGKFLSLAYTKTGSSGAVTITSSNAGVATVSGSTTLSLVGVGTATIGLTVAGDSYNGDASTSFTLTVTKQPSVITILSSSAVNMGDSYTVSVSKTTANTGAVTYTSSNTSVATVAASTGVVTLITPGSTTITASLAADTYYASASTTLTLTVSKGTSTLTYVSPTSLIFGNSPLLNTLSFTKTGSQGAITFANASDTTVLGVTSNNLTTKRAGTGYFNATLAADTKYEQATITPSVFVNQSTLVLAGGLKYILYRSGAWGTPGTTPPVQCTDLVKGNSVGFFLQLALSSTYDVATGLGNSYLQLAGIQDIVKDVQVVVNPASVVVSLTNEFTTEGYIKTYIKWGDVFWDPPSSGASVTMTWKLAETIYTKAFTHQISLAVRSTQCPV
jgi:hypothetical protein